MLYIFQVDTGNMFTFDMNLALDSVSKLKEAIRINCRIPLECQILLVSGGECLESTSRVCNYAAGTDTNPIFLFNRNNFKASRNSPRQHSLGSNENLTEVDSIRNQVEECLALPPTYKTVMSRAYLAQQLWEKAKELKKHCEQYIHEQHLQNQGWRAVVTNLEDYVSTFISRLNTLVVSFNYYINTMEDWKKILECYSSDMDVLSKIVLIPSLLIGDENASPSGTSLLDWIKPHDSSRDLNKLVASCIYSISKLDAKVIENLEKEARIVVSKSGQIAMKEVKGLEERLNGLDKLLLEANELVQEQNDLAQAFAQNQMRASDLKDASILPDLCQSHQHQLIVMSNNHEHLNDIRRRCRNCKEELTANLITRLKWTLRVHTSLSESINHLNIFSENLRRLHCKIGILKQIHVAKEVYCEAVVETHRRRSFTDSYMTWANVVSDRLNKIYMNEISIRRGFASRFNSHFVARLFPGLQDFPSPFANKRPLNFDMNLPKVTVADIQKLQTMFSNILIKDGTPDLTFDTSKITSRSTNPEKLTESETENLKEEIKLLHLENAAKTEEIEKLESRYISQIQSLKEELNEMDCNLDCEKRLRAELVESHEEIVVDLQDKLCQAQRNLFTREQLLGTITHNTGIEKANWKIEKDRLREDYEKMMIELEERLSSEKEAELKEIKEKARGDVEGLRSRYKYMQSMEQKSPTENIDRSLESFEKLPKTEDLTGDLYRAIELIQRSNPDGISPKLLRRIISKLNSGNAGESSTGTPNLIRVRNISESYGGRQSFEVEEENSTRSVYGLDNSAIDATSSVSECYNKEFGDLIIPTQRIISVSNKLLQLHRISINSCKSGDYVFIYWNNSLQSYVIYLTTKNIHFLHTDCLKLINHIEDHPTEGFIASIVEKEFCVARRPQNRYRVPRGFHFYRVRVKVMEILDIDLFLS